MKNYLSVILTVTTASAMAAVEIPKSVETCTNFNTCAQNVRNDFRTAWLKAAKEDDMATFGKMAEMLAKSEVTGWTIDLWSAGAKALVDAGLAQKKKKPEDQKAVMAGFREGGTTFGLWNGTETLTRPDQAYTAVAVNLLNKKMPQKLTIDMQVKKAQAILECQNKAGSPSAKIAAAKVLEGYAYSINPTTPAETNAMLNAADVYRNFLKEGNKFGPLAAFAKDFRTKRAKVLASKDKAKWLGNEIGGYIKADKEKEYLACKKEFLAQPVNLDYMQAIKSARDIATRYPARWDKIRELAEPVFAKRKQLFKGNDLMSVDECLYDIAYGLQDVKTMKAFYAEMSATLADGEAKWEAENLREKKAREAEKEARAKKQKFTPFVRNRAIERPTPWPLNNVRNNFVRTMPDFGEWEAVEPVQEQWLNARNPDSYLFLIRTEAHLGKLARMKELEAILATNATANAEKKFEAKAYVAYMEATDAKSLRKNLSKLRTDEDDKTWFCRLRRAGRLYFNLDPSEKRYDWLMEVIAMSREMLWPEEHIEYEVEFKEDAPRTAEAAYREKIFKDLDTENRMGTYNTYSLFEKEKELALLKSNEKPHLAADAKGKEAAVCACCDAWGLHVYMRFNDPESEKAKDGIASGFYCEYDIQPGGETPFHWNMITRADEPATDQGAVWDSPRTDFKVGAEYIKEDSFIAKDCHVFHIYVPWIMCWNELPKDDDVWRMVLVAGWAGQFGAMGGGAVHELGRGLHFKFDLSRGERAQMTKKLLRQAVRDYHKVRDNWENAEFWVDSDLGDPAFYDEVVKDYLKSCDELAKECEGDLSDKRAEEIRATRLGDLANFRLSLDKKRTDWLKSRLFK